MGHFWICCKCIAIVCASALLVMCASTLLASYGHVSLLHHEPFLNEDQGINYRVKCGDFEINMFNVYLLTLFNLDLYRCRR